MSKRFSVQRTRASARRVPLVEMLEDRQLLTAVIDMRLAGGGKVANVSSVGQVVNMDIYAVVTGKNATGADDGFQSVSGSILSAKTSGGSVSGNLTAGNVAPFNAIGSTGGTPADLNGDGSLDIGNNVDRSSTGDFAARAGVMQTTGGTISGASNTFLIGTASYKVTSLGAGGETDVNFRVRKMLRAAVWREDGQNMLPTIGTVTVGTPVVIKGPVSTAPVVTGHVYKDLNGDGRHETGEAGQAGVTVYVDANKNGKLDAGEKRVTTASDGSYLLTGLSAGTYRIAEVTPAGSTRTAPSAGYFTVTVPAKGTVNGGDFFNKPANAVAVTVDNHQASLVGTWTTAHTPTGFYGTDFLTDGNTAKGKKTATFKAKLPVGGQYLVYARWVNGSGIASNARYSITGTSGTTTVLEDQRVNGGDWVLLGTYTFDAAHGGVVTLSNLGTTGSVIADAVEFVKSA